MMQMSAVGLGSGIDQVSDAGIWEANTEAPLAAMLYAASPCGHGKGIEWVLLARAMRAQLAGLAELAMYNITTNPDELFYSGISQGGIFGGTLVAVSPDIDRGHLGVGQIATVGVLPFREPHTFAWVNSESDVRTALPCLPSFNAGEGNCYRWSGDSSRRLRRVKPDSGDADVHTGNH